MKREDAQPPSSGFVDVHVDGLWSEDMCACGGRPDERMIERWGQNEVHVDGYEERGSSGEWREARRSQEVHGTCRTTEGVYQERESVREENKSATRRRGEHNETRRTDNFADTAL